MILSETPLGVRCYQIPYARFSEQNCEVPIALSEYSSPGFLNYYFLSFIQCVFGEHMCPDMPA